MKFFAGIGLLLLTMTGYCYLHRPIHYPPGVLVESEPSQILLPSDVNSISYGKFVLKPLAVFSLDARVLHRRNYRYDPGAALVPVDLALGWGVMSDERVLDQLNISQSMRCYWYEYRLPPPIPVDDIVSHSSNMHIIPATPEIASKCRSIRSGTLVHLIGDLVEATGPGVPKWTSSLSRTDRGNGACELFYVEEIKEISPDSPTERRVTALR
ncbi:MAG: hypothetical protein ACJ8M1_12895 [Chthoniobacterales bacterium]